MNVTGVPGFAVLLIAVGVACGSDGSRSTSDLDGGPNGHLGESDAAATDGAGNDAAASKTDDGGTRLGDGAPAQDGSTDGSAPSDDPFDPSACGGIPLKGTELLARIGGSAKALGTTVVQYRSRECTSIGAGCGQFTEDETWVHRINSSGQGTSTTVSGQVTLFPWPLPATSASVWLGGASYPGSTIPAVGMNDNVTCSVTETAAVSCGAFAIVFSTHGPSPVGGTLQFRYGSSPLRLTGVITASCLQLLAKGGGVAPPGGPATGGAYVDEEVAVLHRWSPPL